MASRPPRAAMPVGPGTGARCVFRDPPARRRVTTTPASGADTRTDAWIWASTSVKLSVVALRTRQGGARAAAPARSSSEANSVRATAAVSAVRRSTASRSTSAAGRLLAGQLGRRVERRARERGHARELRARVGAQGRVVDHRPPLRRQALQVGHRDPRGRLPLGGHDVGQRRVAQRPPARGQRERPRRAVPPRQVRRADVLPGLPAGHRGGHRLVGLAVQEDEGGVGEDGVQERHAQRVVDAVDQRPPVTGAAASAARHARPATSSVASAASSRASSPRSSTGSSTAPAPARRPARRAARRHPTRARRSRTPGPSAAWAAGGAAARRGPRRLRLLRGAPAARAPGPRGSSRPSGCGRRGSGP